MKYILNYAAKLKNSFDRDNHPHEGRKIYLTDSELKMLKEELGCVELVEHVMMTPATVFGMDIIIIDLNNVGG